MQLVQDSYRIRAKYKGNNKFVKQDLRKFGSINLTNEPFLIREHIRFIEPLKVVGENQPFPNFDFRCYCNILILCGLILLFYIIVKVENSPMSRRRA